MYHAWLEIEIEMVVVRREREKERERGDDKQFGATRPSAVPESESDTDAAPLLCK